MIRVLRDASDFEMDAEEGERAMELHEIRISRAITYQTTDATPNYLVFPSSVDRICAYVTNARAREILSRIKFFLFLRTNFHSNGIVRFFVTRPRYRYHRH